MKIHKFNNEDEWKEARLGKITGTRLKDIINKRSTTPKIGFYEILAERIALPPTDENVMDRGKRLEQYAVERFMQVTGKKVNTDLVLWTRDDNEDIAISPDGYIGKTAAIECKCLSSARHIEAILTNEIPSEYWEQALQYFCVNDALRTLYFVFYDPRMPRDYHCIEVHRKDVQLQVAEYLALEREALQKLKELEDLLTFKL